MARNTGIIRYASHGGSPFIAGRDMIKGMVPLEAGRLTSDRGRLLIIQFIDL